MLRFLVAIVSIVLTIAIMVVALAAWATVHARRLQTEDRIASSPKTGLYVAAYDTRMFVQRAGPGNAPAVVFVPGTGAWSEMWRPYMNEVAARGYQAIAVDLPPFGYSLPPPSGNYNKAEQAKRLLAALDSMGIGQATFVSHSIGSGPVMEALLNHPERVRKLVLVSPALGLDSPAPGGREPALQRLTRKRWFIDPLSAILTNPTFTEVLVKHFVAEKDKVSEDWVGLYRRPFRLAGSYRNVALWIPELLARRSALKSDNPESYGHINFPVTLIWGTSDFITPMSQAEHLQAFIPNAVLMTLPGGHVPMIEEPAQFSLLLAKAIQ